MNATQYSRVNELLSEYSTLSSALERAEANIKTVQLEAAKTLLPEYAQLKVRVAELDVLIRSFCDEHYNALFPDVDRRTHKTPFGDVKYHKSSSLEFDDADQVVVKIYEWYEREKVAAAREKRTPIATPDQLIRTRLEPNLDVLSTLDETILSAFGLRVETKDNFKVTPFTLKTDKPAKAPKTKPE
jgi:hypothetical protein